MSGFISILGLLINATLIATPPLLLAALGSCFSERSGVVNIGIEGMMTIGAFTGTVVALYTGNGWLGFLCGGLAPVSLLSWASASPSYPLCVISVPTMAMAPLWVPC